MKFISRFTQRIILMMLKLILCCLIATSVGVTAATIPVIDVTAVTGQGNVRLISQAQILEDKAGLKLSAIISLKDTSWQLNADDRTNLGRSEYNYWIRFRLQGLQQADPSLLMRLSYPHLDEIDVYFVDGDSVLTEYLTGDTRTFASRPVAERIYVFPLQSISLNQIDVYVRVKTQGPLLIPLDLVTRNEFERGERIESYWIGAYMGIMLIMFFYNLFVFILVRDRSYLFYLLYVACVASLQFSLVGLSLQYIWPQSATLNNTVILLLSIAMPLSAVLFVMQFLKLMQNGLRLEKLLAKTLIASYLVLFVCAFVASYSLVLTLSHATSFISIISGFYLGVAYWARGVKAAQTFAMAWFVYLIFVLAYLLEVIGLTPSNVISRHALEIGSALELTLLSLAFGHRINEEKEKRLDAQQQALSAQLKLNQDLDELVRQRTEELEFANLQLIDLSTKDGLTGVYNRRHFDEIFNREYQHAFREKNWLSLVMLDADHFKNLNDTYGHPFGDLCLQKIANTLKSCTHRPPDVVARYGGEEFVVLLPGADRDGGLVVAEKIRKHIADMNIEHGKVAVPLTVSVGVISIAPSSADGQSQMLSRVDTRLYLAKQNGRNCVIGAD